jgi:protein-tyrosine phosphatase
MFDQLYFERVTSGQPEEIKKRHLPFSGAKNFRDLGGYQMLDGHTVRWNVLYRSDSLHKLTDSDLRYLSALMLERVIDFRVAHEKQLEPDRLPKDADIRVVEIPIFDASTRVWHNAREGLEKYLKDVNPAQYMIKANVELATRFIPEMRHFLHEVLSANGKPILFHCAAGKDRTGFAAAVLLQILGVPFATVMQDYLLSNQYYLSSYRWGLMLLRLVKGKRFAEVTRGFMEVRPEYLSAGFDYINREFNSFENYVSDVLGLTEKDVERLKSLYLV